MRLGITSNKMTHCNINHYFHFHSSLQSEAAKDVLLAALLVGSILHTGAKLLPGRGQCCTPQHLLESGRRSLTQEIWIRTLVKSKDKKHWCAFPTQLLALHRQKHNPFSHSQTTVWGPCLRFDIHCKVFIPVLYTKTSQDVLSFFTP